jgi:formylglycine-generating enzyme required for sulfatase activity
MRKLSRREFIVAAGAGLATCLRGQAPGEADDIGRPNDDMVLIPAGVFLMGTREDDASKLARAAGYHVSWLSGEVPQHEVELPGFLIDKYSVTNARFAEFCRAAGHPPRSHWNGPTPPKDILDHPVTHVNRADAEAYARWAGMRLPTEAEWEKAARGSDGRTFPWGEEFRADACHWNREHTAAGPGTAPVTAHPGGASPYGVMDMVGNVAEFCADGPARSIAYIKGGCWLTEQTINLRPAARTMSGAANNALIFYGFRCAKDAP